MYPLPETNTVGRDHRSAFLGFDDGDGVPEENLLQHLGETGERSGSGVQADTAEAPIWDLGDSAHVAGELGAPAAEWEGDWKEERSKGRREARSAWTPTPERERPPKQGRTLAEEERRLVGARTTVKARKQDKKQEKAQWRRLIACASQQEGPCAEGPPPPARREFQEAERGAVPSAEC